MGKHPTLALTHTLYASAGADYFGGMSNQGLRIHIALRHVTASSPSNLAHITSLHEGSVYPLHLHGAVCFYMAAIGAPTHGDICSRCFSRQLSGVILQPSAKGHTAEDFSWRPVQTAC